MMSRPALTRPTTSDGVAGASVAMVLIPQSLAYADLAGLPAHIGLFASALPLIAFSLFASSPFLQTGPTAVMSLLTLAALPAVAAEDLPKLAALLALLVGAARFAYGLAGIGRIVRLISLPVVTGFTTGAAILIICSQIPRVLGVPAGSGGVVANALSSIVDVGAWDFVAVTLGVVTVAVVRGARRISPLFPGVLLAVVIAAAWSALVDYQGATIGHIPSGLPPISFDLPWNQAGSLVVGAAVISLVGFAEPVSIARTYAQETGQRWDPDQEFRASGIANAVASICGGYPIGGSFSRSSVNRLAGAQTRASGGITGLIVLGFVPFARVLSTLPTAVLAGIVIAAVLALIKPRRQIEVWKRSRPEAMLSWVTLGATLLFAPRIERAVLVGVALTVVVHLAKRLRMDRVTDAAGDTTVTPRGLIWMASETSFRNGLFEAVNEGAGTVTIDFGRTGFVSDGAAEAVADAAKALARQNRTLDWCNAPAGTARL